jgi:hypothetical protein
MPPKEADEIKYRMCVYMQMPDSLFFILEGDVEMLDEGAVLRMLKTGDTFGAEAVLCNITTPLEFKSASFCRVLLMPRAELNVRVIECTPCDPCPREFGIGTKRENNIHPHRRKGAPSGEQNIHVGSEKADKVRETV